MDGDPRIFIIVITPYFFLRLCLTSFIGGDSLVLLLLLPGLIGSMLLQAFFGVFDGHGGAKAAEFAAKNMDKNILQLMAGNSDSCMEEAVRDAHLKTDADFMLENADGGTCCVSAWIRKGKLIISNAGDCRAVMSRGGTAETLTTDHRPSLESERERVEALVSKGRSLS